MKEKVQKFGRFLSGMVMPNIGAFIAWGFITALFIPDGWLANAKFAVLVDPMVKYLLPMLIAYTGGKMIHDTRGGVAAAIAVFGVIVGSDVPMFLGAMIVGPLSGWVMKQFDRMVDGKIPAGFEMLVNNFSLGIIGLLLALLSLTAIGPLVAGAISTLSKGIKVIVEAKLLPLASIIIEPAKVLFLNNAMNHGIFGPLGLEQIQEAGRSIFYIIETNPGPGLGVLLACMFSSKGVERQTAPGAIIIQFFGGIHEIYFPYILMQPLLVLAVIGGGAAGVFTFQLLDAGLVGPLSPGSIIALLPMAPKGGLLAVLAGVAVSAIVSFVIATFIYRMGNTKQSLEESQQAVNKLKKQAKGQLATEAVSSSVAGGSVAQGMEEQVMGHEPSQNRQNGRASADEAVDLIVFACDAGMGSSAMGATTLRKKFSQAGVDIRVENYAIDAIPTDARIVVTHQSLQARAHERVPEAEIIPIQNFLSAPEYGELVDRFKRS